MNRSVGFFLVMLLLVAGVLALGPVVAAQPGGWSVPIEISQPNSAPPASVAQLPSEYGSSSWFPDIVVGPSGSVHIVWHSSIRHPEDTSIVDSNPAEAAEQDWASTDVLLYREMRNGGWSPINDIVAPTTSGFTMRASLATARDGNLHALFREGTNIFYFRAPVEEAWMAGAWSSPQIVSAGGAGYYTALAADSNGNLHAFWTEGASEELADIGCPTCVSLVHRSGDGTGLWSLPHSISNPLDHANRPQVQIDQFDRIHVVWDEGFDWLSNQGEPDIGIYRRSDDGGNTWSTPQAFGFADDTVMQTTLALTADGNPLVVYQSIDGERLYWQSSSDGGNTWGPPTEVPGVRTVDNELDSYSMTTDSAGTVHLLMAGIPAERIDEQENPWLLHLTWDGATWSEPEVVMGNDLLYPEWPRIVTASGNTLHATWFTRNEADRFTSDDASYQVWYSGTSLTTPAIEPMPLFTPTPRPMPTTTPVPTTVVPEPTLEPEVAYAPVADGLPRWERRGVRTVAIALVPLVGLLVVLGGLKLRRRL